MPVTDLPAFLNGIRSVGTDRWVALCPAHDDRRPSLSLRLKGDRWLVICFAGCELIDIVNSIGLEIADLFHHRQTRRSCAGERLRLSAAEQLELLEHEVSVVAILAADFLERRAITESHWQRLAQAVARIGRARHA